MRSIGGRTLASAVIVICAMFWLLQYRNGSDGSWTRSLGHSGVRSAEDVDGPSLRDIKNTTLGFEKILVIGFSERSDKRDAITLGASYTGLEVDWIEAVRSQDMNPKAYPAAWKEENHLEKPSELGSWRAHMNALRYIVENKISSALIMEDDSDWDVNLKAQMTEFARGTRILQGDKSGGPSSRSPYGDDWDMLWLGHCGMRSLQEERGEQPAFYIIPNDTTVRPPQHKMDFVNPRLAESPGFENHRLVFTGEGPICSWSLAFTYDGARKALTALSMVGVDQPVDLGYNFLCSGNLGFPIRCFSTYPSLMGTWTQQGPTSRNSDIVESDVVDWHDASSQTMVYSTMLNMMALANNSTKIRAQWEEARQAEIDLSTFEIPNGFLLFGYHLYYHKSIQAVFDSPGAKQ